MIHWRTFSVLLITLSWGCGTTAPEQKQVKPEATIEPTPSLEKETPDPSTGQSDANTPPLLFNKSDEANRLADEGMGALQNYNFVDATKKLKESMVFSQPTDRTRHALIAAYLRSGNVIGAMNQTQDWINAAPDDSTALTMRVKTLLRANRKTEADSLVSQFLSKHPDNLEIRNLQARVDLMMGFPKRAIRRSAEVMKKDEVNIDAVINIARAYLQLKKSDLTLYVVDQGLSVKKVPELYHIMAQVYIQRKSWQRAVAALRECLKLAPDFPEGLNNLGVVYQQVGDYSSAIAQLEKATQVAPGMLSSHLNLGNAYRGTKQFKKAESAYLAALKLDQSYADAYFNLGILFFENQVSGLNDEVRLQKAVTNFNQYKLLSGSELKRKDPVDDYIDEAKRMIAEVKRMREEEMKQPPVDETPVDSSEPVTDPTSGEQPLESPDVAPVNAPEPATTPEPVPEPATTPEPVPEPATAPEPVPEPAITPEPVPEPATAPEPVPEPSITPEPVPEPAITPEPVPEPTITPEPIPDPAPTPQPAPEPLPNPETVPEEKPDDVPEVEPLPSPDELPVPEDIPVPESSSLDSARGMR